MSICLGRREFIARRTAYGGSFPSFAVLEYREPPMNRRSTCGH
jgi:hypothetical protein